MNLVQEIRIIIHDLLEEGMEINEPFQVTAIIEKLPLMWRDFKNYLKHKRKELKLEELIVRLRIEEDSRTSDIKAYKKAMEAEAKANLTKSSNAQKRKRPFNGKKRWMAKKFKGTCYSCGKQNHMSKDCRLPKSTTVKEQVKRTLSNIGVYQSTFWNLTYLLSCLKPTWWITRENGGLKQKPPVISGLERGFSRPRLLSVIGNL
ncbi:hypothetical protein F511_06628 [Dorcoceras hygrometricum]|uniref:CCHC-type domain-containing protein n=1 Tax=Dorcoceras hygrometricum TaxID=472368 RepID=A0A2Z7AMU7_9LAMI|nr:hypothetical protein F511_06628 [Dorcoceras hygrometricum]